MIKFYFYINECPIYYSPIKGNYYFFKTILIFLRLKKLLNFMLNKLCILTNHVSRYYCGYVYSTSLETWSYFSISRIRNHFRHGLQHLQLFLRWNHLHEKTVWIFSHQRRISVQAHWTSMQLCPPPRTRLRYQRQYVSKLVPGQVSFF